MAMYQPQESVWREGTVGVWAALVLRKLDHRVYLIQYHPLQSPYEDASQEVVREDQLSPLRDWQTSHQFIKDYLYDIK